MNALDIARAACQEVGLPEHRIDWNPYNGNKSLGIWAAGCSDEVRALYRRAAWLGVLATGGPEVMTRCHVCFDEWLDTERCITVRDALAGRTCGKFSFAAPCSTAGGLSRATGGDVPPPEHVPPV